MLFKWKKLYLLAEERIESQRKYIKEIKKDKDLYNNIINTINNIINEHNTDNLNMYFYNNNLYYIVDTWRPSTGDNYILDLNTYNLSVTSSCRISHIAELNARLDINYMNGYKIADLISIDTLREKQNGHGSQILKRFIYLCKVSNVNIVEGELFRETPIGIENLKKFYIQNGFNIIGKRFKMIIKEPLPKY